MDNEKGQILPLALLVLVIGTLAVAPFLRHAGTSLIGSRTYRDAMVKGSYSCDVGIEHGIWRLTNDGLAEKLPDPGDSISYKLEETVNGVTPKITVTTKSVSGGVGGVSVISVME